MDIGLLMLRLVAGLLLAGHGVQKMFGWFGGPGLTGAGGFMESLGYRPGRRHATLAAATEIGAGFLLAFGFLTPLAAAAFVGVVLNIIFAALRRKGLWATNGGYEYPLLLAVAGLMFAFTGPGDLSVDVALDWNLAGTEWGVAAAAVGIVAGAALLAMRRTTEAAEPNVVAGDATATIGRTDDRTFVRR